MMLVCTMMHGNPMISFLLGSRCVVHTLRETNTSISINDLCSRIWLCLIWSGFLATEISTVLTLSVGSVDTKYVHAH